MERGTVSLSNLELTALNSLAVAYGCQKQDLLAKLQPVKGANNDTDTHNVLLSEDDAEIMLDCMSSPAEETDQHIVSSRIKIQKFITRCRL